MSLKFDSQGFIIGIRQANETAKLIHDDTQEIIRLLRGELKTLNTQKTSSHQKSLAQQTTKKHAKRHAKTISKHIQKHTQSTSVGTSEVDKPTAKIATSNSQRQRDEKGRFVSNGNSQTAKINSSKTQNSGLNVPNLPVMPNMDSIDPIFGAIGEVRSLFDPVTRFMGFFGGFFKTKQDKYNKGVIKKLKAIIVAIRNQQQTPNLPNPNIGLPAIGKKKGKFGKLGSLLSRTPLGKILAISGLATTWGSLSKDERGEQIGSIVGGLGGAYAGGAIGATIGSVVPVVGTAVGGVLGALVGGFLGSEGGSALARVASPHLSHFTDTLKRQNLAEKMLSSWQFGLNPFFLGVSALVRGAYNFANGKSQQQPSQNKRIYHGNFSNYGVNGSATASTTQSSVHSNGVKAGKNSQYDHLILASAQRHGVDPALVKAVIHQESQFNPNARSPVGAMGLMQLMPATAREMGVKNAFDPAQNIEGGTKYLAWLSKQFKSKDHIIAAYNAGLGNVRKYGGIPPFRETRNYVQKVNGYHRHYANGGVQTNQTAKVATTSTGQALVVGDSIANQYAKVNGGANYGKDGRSPSEVLNTLRQIELAQKRVVLSTGLSNNMQDWQSVEQQLALLSSKKAKFSVLGVANNYKDNANLGELVNEKLRGLVTKYGGEFMGGFRYNSSDRYKAHPSNDWIKSKARQNTTARQNALPAPPTTPNPPQIMQKLNDDKPMLASQEAIGQNISDDELALVLTGGLGARRV